MADNETQFLEAFGTSGLKFLTQVAWAAGLFEGEGYFGLDVNKTRSYPHAVVGSTDKDTLDRFACIVGVGKINGPYKPRGKGIKPMYRWQVAGAPAARVGRMLYPFLLERRQTQVATALAAYKPERNVKWL